VAEDRHITNIQVGLGCDRNCAACARFFDCTSPLKADLYKAPALRKIQKRLADIKYKIAILSGKGGVGKSTVTVNLAGALVLRGAKVGILDSDFYGPSIPTMTGVRGKRMSLTEDERGMLPVVNNQGIKVASVGATIEEAAYVTWMGDELRWGLYSFLGNTIWGELDFLLIDLPPGTGEETTNVMKAVQDLDGAIMITIPSDISQVVVGRCITLCQKGEAPILGVIENMGTMHCPSCTKSIDVFSTGGGKVVCEKTGVPYLGSIPLDSKVCDASDEGIPFVIKYPELEASKIFMGIAREIAVKIGYLKGG